MRDDLAITKILGQLRFLPLYRREMLLLIALDIAPDSDYTDIS